MQKKIRLNVPYLGNDDLTKTAEEFLVSMGQNDGPPVDIEAICDSLGIAIHAVPRLKRDLGIDAYITSDFKTIVIDGRCFEQHERRARFSIAHELAHMLLHADIYQQFDIQSLDDYLSKQNALHPDTERRIETQAYILAGLLLVPPAMLKETIETQYSAAQLRNLTINDVHKLLILCAEHFFVSNEVILRRFKHDYPELLNQVIPELG